MLRLRKGETPLGLLTCHLFAIVSTSAWEVINKHTIDLMPLEKNSCLVCNADKLAAACSRVPASCLSRGFGTDPRGAVLTHPVTAACPPHHQRHPSIWRVPPQPRCCRTVPASHSNDALSPLSLAGNLISPANDTLSYFGAGLQRGKQSTSAIWLEDDNPEEGGGWWHSQKSVLAQPKVTAGGLGGTFCLRSLPSLGFLFYFPGGGERGRGNQNQHGLPMSSVPLFPLPPSVITVGIGFFLPCPELWFSLDSDETPGKT